MPSTPPATRVLAAAVTGAATAAYYASPDVVRSRTARGWLKTGLSLVAAAGSFPESRRAGAAAETARVERGDPPLRETFEAAPARGRTAVVAAGAVAVAGSVAGVVALERWIFRRGEARSAAGVRWAHTRTALVLGALAAAVTLLPDPEEVLPNPADPADPADTP